jgi:ribosomal protein S27E
MFGKLDLRAEVVNGVCPTCSLDTLLVSISQDRFRCITCGSDLKQHVNGKISYIPHATSPDQIRFETPKNG